MAGDERHELSKTRQRLGTVESVLRDARADAGAVATGQLAAARHRRADAMVALETATDEVGRQEARLAELVRGA